jgi:predicted nucleic acid-binding protein
MERDESKHCPRLRVITRLDPSASRPSPRPQIRLGRLKRTRVAGTRRPPPDSMIASTSILNQHLGHREARDADQRARQAAVP